MVRNSCLALFVINIFKYFLILLEHYSKCSNLFVTLCKDTLFTNIPILIDIRIFGWFWFDVLLNYVVHSLLAWQRDKLLQKKKNAK